MVVPTVVVDRGWQNWFGWIEEELLWRLVVFRDLRLARNATAVLGARVFSFAVRLVTVKLLASSLGLNSFGLYSYIVALTEMLAILSDLGVADIGVREISRSWDDASSHLGNILVLKALLSCITLIVTIGAVGVIRADKLIVEGTLVYSLAVVLDYYALFVFIPFRASEQMHYETLVVLFERSCFLALILVIVRVGGGLKALFFARLIAACLKFALAILVALKLRMPLPRLFHLDCERGVMCYYLRSSLPVGISTFIVGIFARIDIVLLNLLRSSTESGIFAGAYRIIDAMRILAVSLVGASFPLLARYAKNDFDSFVRFSRRIGFTLLVVAFSGALLLFIWPHEVVYLLLDQEFGESTVALRILSFGVLLTYLSSLLSYVLTSVGKQFIYTMSVAVGLGFKMAIDLLLIPSLGYRAACVGVLATEFVIFMINFIYVQRYMHLIPSIRAIVWPALSLLLPMITGYLLRNQGVMGALLVVLVSLSILLVLGKTFFERKVPA